MQSAQSQNTAVCGCSSVRAWQGFRICRLLPPGVSEQPVTCGHTRRCVGGTANQEQVTKMIGTIAPIGFEGTTPTPHAEAHASRTPVDTGAGTVWHRCAA